MSSEWAIEAHGLGKRYLLFDRPGDRLRQLLFGRWLDQDLYREFWALREVDFSIARGEVVGLVGRNGAGKSTLLQMVCQTLQPSVGELQVHGRVAALLELGAGFNPDFTGLENVFMNGAILGLNRWQVQERLDDIIGFADIGDFIHQPVKTYSSGMFMRLAFSVATSVEPDILVVDEALSVGDGAFARKSFDRIMSLRDAGTTILFCSHSMYQVEALCSRALWIDEGRLRMSGSAANVTTAYNASLNAQSPQVHTPLLDQLDPHSATAAPGAGRVVAVRARSSNQSGNVVTLLSGVSDLMLEIEFALDPNLPAPGIAIGIADSSERTVASASTVNDDVALQKDAQGRGSAAVRFPKIPLLKGRYQVTVILTSENGIHPYDIVMHCVALEVQQKGIEQGIVALNHEWLP